MDPFSEFEHQLQELLNHLHDPDFLPGALVSQVVENELDQRQGEAGTQGDSSVSRADAVKSRVIQAIQSFAPVANSIGYARKQRLHAVLECRYVQRLTQEITAEQLSITPRHLRREQTSAVHGLALHLWQRRAGETSTRDWKTQGRLDRGAAAQKGESAGYVFEKETGRDEQVRQEVTAFRENASAETAEVGAIFMRVAELISPLLSQKGIALEIEQPPNDTVTAVNPTALRQILVRGVMVLSREMSTGSIRLGVEILPDGIVISIQASPVQEQALQGDALIQELIESYHGSWSLNLDEDRVVCRIVLPSTGSINVLVVDDNADLIYTYQRYTQGTPYRLFAAHDGSSLFETIRSVSPDIVILDVMLPDVDGWELLSRLREHPETHHLPVILSTVVEEEELAHALGAAGYISKPVRYHEFIRALDDASVRLKQERR